MRSHSAWICIFIDILSDFVKLIGLLTYISKYISIFLNTYMYVCASGRHFSSFLSKIISSPPWKPVRASLLGHFPRSQNVQDSTSTGVFEDGYPTLSIRASHSPFSVEFAHKAPTGTSPLPLPPPVPMTSPYWSLPSLPVYSGVTWQPGFLIPPFSWTRWQNSRRSPHGPMISNNLNSLSLYLCSAVGVPVLPAKLQGHPPGDAGLVPHEGSRVPSRLLREHPGLPGFLHSLRVYRGPGPQHGHWQTAGCLSHLCHWWDNNRHFSYIKGPLEKNRGKIYVFPSSSSLSLVR